MVFEFLWNLLKPLRFIKKFTIILKTLTYHHRHVGIDICLVRKNYQVNIYSRQKEAWRVSEMLKHSHEDYDKPEGRKWGKKSACLLQLQILFYCNRLNMSTVNLPSNTYFIILHASFLPAPNSHTCTKRRRFLHGHEYISLN